MTHTLWWMGWGLRLTVWIVVALVVLTVGVVLGVGMLNRASRQFVGTVHPRF